jgi:hypothetical protein
MSPPWRPPLSSLLTTSVHLPGDKDKDKAWHHRAHISEDVEIVMARGPSNF